MTKLLLASRNAKKLRELQRIVASEGLSGIEVLSLNDVSAFPEAPETAPDFEGNALAKARDAAAATGLISVADDSGIEIDALNGMPGVLSARWSGKHGDDEGNIDLVLGQLGDVPDERRGGAFVSVVAMVVPGGDEVVVRGEWRGTIRRERSGANGFGYDPIFQPEGYDITSAEMTAEQKDSLSHRGRALRLLVPHLRELG
ncbi:non-canonical purine NTP pyrophosphatase [Lentzea sp. NBRC 105346]|uniref:RdgB/HAM1 family non-canonical purine NTP pyrophosphatase n=1 Tax=Lentzea sp. NBRC 105346 TaxID=3032205 RepID=UPI0024A5F3A2|nr:RdgB/HAM1 family non-canonical purine NTP pyrophosphatase [Lentzea sp. NBRC 105346]GLZ31161.1 non-canonical purine NTP pyrophosphatase [Lentzea sp. NBRC 105346]